MGCVGGSNGLAQRRAKQAWLLLPPIPAYFSDASEAVHYAQEHKFVLF